MTTLKRFYALTSYMPIEVSEVPNMKMRSSTESVVEAQNETTRTIYPTEKELRNRAIQAAMGLGSLSSVLLFEDLTQAKEYVEQTTQITQDRVKGKIKSTKKQRGIVEVMMDWDAVKDNTSHQDTANPHRELTQNTTQDYVAHQVWLHNLSPILLPVKASSKYQKFFNNTLSPQYQAAALFEEYYHPSFFSIHRRHHQVKAKVLDEVLINCQDAQEAYQTLFSARRIVLNHYPYIKRRGSFMLRMDYALDRLSIPAIAAQAVVQAEMAKEAAALIKKTLAEAKEYENPSALQKITAAALKVNQAVDQAKKAAEKAERAAKQDNAEAVKMHAKIAKEVAEIAEETAKNAVEIVKALKDEASYFTISVDLNLPRFSM